MDFFSFHEQVRNRPGAAPSSSPAAEPLTISQLTAKIDAALRKELPSTVHVRGEISNFNHHRQSGHFYFTLKDPHACIDCVIFKSDNVKLKFTPDDGLEVLATGGVKVYRERGKYQLYVTRLEPLGQGALELAFRQLSAKLEKEGLFSAERKKPLPCYPQRIVLVTSAQTAALQDMLKVLRRYPWLSLRLCHVRVQGDGAARRIAGALRDLDCCAASLGGIDLILLSRGGGSLEDLREFNEECVARAIAASSIPIVTGIGHEIDISIADLVADYHAHTPTEAAQVATAHWRSAGETIDGYSQQLRRQIRQRLDDARLRLEHAQRHEFFRRPLDRINQARQTLDLSQRALAMAISTRFRSVRERLQHASMRLLERHPRHALRLHLQRVEHLQQQFRRAACEQVLRHRARIDSLAKLLHAVGPEQVLHRGYTITTLKKTGAVVRSSALLRQGEKIVTRFADGAVESTVNDAKQLSLFE